jgi:tetratricopeptide (TPR) repeat protein
LVTKGQFAEARKVSQDLFGDANRSVLAPNSQAGFWRLMGLVENRLGRYDGAQAALERGIKLRDSSEQPELMIALLIDLADVHFNQSALDEASRLLSRAGSIASKHLPRGHPRTGVIQHSLGLLFWLRGELSKAEKAFRLALTIHETALGRDHMEVAIAASALAGLLTSTRRQTEAISLLERSKTILERDLGSSNPNTIGATFA